jgi:hypothetical protein
MWKQVFFAHTKITRTGASLKSLGNARICDSVISELI